MDMCAHFFMRILEGISPFHYQSSFSYYSIIGDLPCTTFHRQTELKLFFVPLRFMTSCVMSADVILLLSTLISFTLIPNLQIISGHLLWEPVYFENFMSFWFALSSTLHKINTSWWITIWHMTIHYVTHSDLQ